MTQALLPPPDPANAALPALAVFSGETEFWWLKGLKPGFRHCFLVLEIDGVWVVFDPLSHQTRFGLFPAGDAATLAAGYEASGCTVAPCLARPAPPKRAPLLPHTCVEAVKRVLGLHARGVLTPWQLYKKLKQDFFP